MANILRRFIPRDVTSPACVFRRFIQQTCVPRAITHLQMPAMSPTMTEGGITAWKKREGEAFSAGDVLLEIETDKATIDVEAQDDGVLGKILLQDGAKNVHVGKVIALLAEEGDDISSLEAPKEEPAVASPSHPPPAPSTSSEPLPATPPESPTSAPHISHSRPLFPSVHRLLHEYNITTPQDIKGTGVRGMLTKGDILTYLGKTSGPSGTYKESPSPQGEVKKPEAKPEPKPLDGPAIRRLIVSTMLQNSLMARAAQPPATAPTFDSVVADYLPKVKAPATDVSVSPSKERKRGLLDGLY